MSNDAELFALARRVTEEVMGPPPFAIGDCVHRPDGRLVKIIGGQWWGTHGLSNFWDWREVLPNGELGEPECGYGWNPGESSPHETLHRDESA
jgi:hypothetical protein